MDNLLKTIEELRARLSAIWRLLDIDGQKNQVKELERDVENPEFWSNHGRAVEKCKKLEELKSEVAKWDNLQNEIQYFGELLAEAASENDISFTDESQIKIDELKKKLDEQEFFMLFSGKYDRGNAIISIHAGTGGVDAQDWAQILERMFLRFAESKSWRTEVLDRTVGNEAGIKSVALHIKGQWAYGYLCGEAGVHRLVRISPFDAEAMRHTSFALVEVIPELPETEAVAIKDEDIRVDVYRSSGPGGQSVNTTDSAVRITHLPTGIVVACQNERSQHQNRESAMKILKAKVYRQEEEKRDAEERRLRGETQKAEWGKQIRSYVMQPYKMVKDHRTDQETQDIDAVLNGGLNTFAEAYLRWRRSGR